MGNTYIFDDSHDYTGAVATFTDTHGTSRITNISVPFSPIQDLHGYDHPWPAGGGVNKLDISTSLVAAEGTITQGGVTATYNADGSIRLQASTSGRADINIFPHATYPLIVPAGTYTFSISGNAGYEQYIHLCASGSGDAYNGAQYFDVATSATITVVDGYKPWNYVLFRIFAGGSFDVTVKIQLEQGSTATAYSPYENICPITGRTGLSVYDDPKYGGTIYWNQMLDGFASSSNATYHPFKNGQEIIAGNKYLTHVKRSTNSGRTAMGIYSNYTGATVNIMQFIDIPANGDLDWYSINTASGYGISNGTSSGSPNMWVYRNGYTPVDTVTSVELFDLTKMFGAGNEPTIAGFQALFPKDSYLYNAGETTCVSAVNGDTYWKKDIDWTTQAGTVYGGTLDVVTGVLTVDRAIVDLGTLTWNKSSGGTGRFAASIPTSIAPPYKFESGTEMRCSAYAFDGFGNSDIGYYGASGTIRYYYRAYGSAAQETYVVDESKDSLTTAQFKTAMNGVQLCYELATPLTYQLTAQEVSVIKNSLNNVWASTGSSITVTVTDIAYGFQGWLIKVGNPLVEIPTTMIEAESYKVTPDQRMEESAERDTTGYLWRDTVRNTPPKIEFNTPPVNNTQVAALNAIFQSAFTVKSQRKLQVAFFDPEEDCYKIWDCYMPDVEYPMHLIDPDAKTILYDSIRYAFIGY